MKLLNVRVNPDDARMAAELRRKGTRVSDVVRAAIREAYARRDAATPRKPREIMAAIYRDHPDSAGPPRVRLDLRDRAQVRRVIRKRVRRRA